MELDFEKLVPQNIWDQIKDADCPTKALVIHSYMQGYYNGQEAMFGKVINILDKK